MKLPFGWLPGHWGLTGSTREIARIEYENDDPFEREYKVAEFKGSSQKELLDIKLKYDKITKIKHQDLIVDLLDDGYEKSLLSLKLLIERNEITELEYEKELSTLNELPWFNMGVEYRNGELDLDLQWNSFYIQMLKRSGYAGSTDQEVIDWYVRDFGRKLSTDDDNEEEVNETNFREYK